jgi:hypothetical protein
MWQSYCLNNCFCRKIGLASTKSISLSETQNLILKKQGLTPSTQGTSKADVVDIARDLREIQYDPLPVIASSLSNPVESCQRIPKSSAWLTEHIAQIATKAYMKSDFAEISKRKPDENASNKHWEGSAFQF